METLKLNAELENLEELVLGYRYVTPLSDFDPLQYYSSKDIGKELHLLLASSDSEFISEKLYHWYLIANNFRERKRNLLSADYKLMETAAIAAKEAILSFLKLRVVSDSNGRLELFFSSAAAKESERACRLIEQFFDDYAKSIKLAYGDNLNLWFLPWQLAFVLARGLRRNPRFLAVLQALINKGFKPQGPANSIRPFYLCHIMIEVLTGASSRAASEPSCEQGFISAMLKKEHYVFNDFADDEEMDFVGVPGGTAFKIAEDYLYGKNLKRNRHKALFWFRHGAMTGEPRCLTACIMLDRDLNAVQANIDDLAYCAKENFYLLQNAFLMAEIYRKESEKEHVAYDNPKSLPHDLLFTNDSYIKQDELKPQSISDDCLFNLFCWYEYVLSCTGIDEPIWPNADRNLMLQPLVYNVLLQKADCKSNAELSTALGVYLDHFQVDQGFYKARLPLTFKNKDNIGDRIARMEAIMAPGIKTLDPFSLNYYIRLLRDEDQLQRLTDEQIKALKRQEDDLCLMMLADRQLSSQVDFFNLPNDIVALWTIAAKRGNSLGMMNLAAYLAISDQNREKAKFWARRALAYGMPSAYFLLYKLDNGTHHQLSCSYLFMATKYLLPEACLELAALQKQGLFEPLPFISFIEELELGAKSKIPFCLVLSDLYNQGGLMPQNRVKALALLQQAASLGDNSCMAVLDEEMSRLFSCEENPLDFFRPLNSTLYNLVNSDFLATDSKRLLNERQQARNLMQKIYDSLISGETEFEKSILLHCAQNSLWKHFSLNEERCRYGKLKTLSLEVPKMFTALTANFPEIYKSDNLTSYSEGMRYLAFNDPEDSRYGYALKALLSLRSLQLPPDLALFKKMTKLACNTEVQLCVFTAYMHLDGIFSNPNKIRIEKSSQTKQNQKDRPEDIMITAINQ